MAKFESDRWKSLSALLDEALDLDNGARTTWLERLAADDAATADALRRLLGHAKMVNPAALITDKPFDELLRNALVDEDAVEPPSQRIGPWTTRSVLGAGGMGAVYLAERELDAGTQRGALKLIKRGMDSGEILARFRRERQILIRLAHPSIAPLLDGGVTAEGRPYLVTGYIDGVPLGQWAKRNDIDLDARCNLILQLCDAVAHAHRLLIVHRDIKPSNVLVDADNRPHLLDFGIAKMLENTGDAQRTATASRVFTRAYAAPEQASGATVTTAVDVYQLGVLLFELLTGARFHDNPDATTGHPSQRLAGACERASQNGPQAVNPRALRGDAGVIVARATDTDPSRRYPTVAAFADDIRRWRAGRPILARADSRRYRVAKFARRHIVGIAAIVAIAVALIAGTGIALWQARKADSEALLARSAQAFLTSIFEASSPDSAAGQRVTARELLDRGSERIDNELKDQPRLRGEMALTLGSLYAQLGQYPQATRLLQSALATIDGSPSSRLRAEIELAAVDLAQSRLDDAERRLAFLLASDPDPVLHSRALAERARLREKQGRLDEGLADARAALELDLARGDAAGADQARDRQIEALILTRRARFDEAAAAFEKAIATARRFYAEDDTRVALMLNDYAVALHEKGRTADAEVRLRKALEIRRKRLGDQHPAVAESLQILGAMQRSQGRVDQAQASLEEALAIQRKVLGDHHPEVANTLNSLGMLDFSRRRLTEAERFLTEAVATYRALGQADTAYAATAANNLATVLVQLGRYDEAEPLTRGALEIHLKQFGEMHPVVMSDLNSLAQLEMRRGHFDAAIGYAQRAAHIGQSPVSPPQIGAYVRLSFANILVRANHPDQALAEVDGAIATLEKINPDDARMPIAWIARALALIGLQRTDEAKMLAQRALEKLQASAPNDVPAQAVAHIALARVADAQRHTADAERERKTAHTLLAGVASPDPDTLREIDRR